MRKKKTQVRRSAPRRARNGNGSSPSPTSETDPASTPPRYVVGVGSSAGGLEALRGLISGLAHAEGLCLVIVQHLAPQHRSRLVEIIGHDTRLRVKEIAHREPPRSNTIYITPPNRDVALEGGLLTLKPPESKVGPKPSVDVFFKSLADEIGENAIGIILSGTGSDGALGVRAIKAAGGVTFCQSLPTAKYDGMPRAAKQTGAIDLELTLEEMAKQLSRLSELAMESGDHLDAPLRFLPVAQDPFHTILGVLEKTSQVDFTQYKPSTVRRRLERRMVANRCQTMAEYAEYLRYRPEEARLLFQDILISVTSFFRDQGAFQALQRQVLERVRSRPEGRPFRAWVVGCATGEEAYSVGILLFEALEKAGRHASIQIFATDIDEHAMAIARKGLYAPEAISHLPPPLRAKYFEEREEGFKVREHLRDAIVFARHDVSRDPPFLKLDLISCRNVLIYFSAPLQAQVLRLFHFALEEEGLLFLGKSEATTVAPELFDLPDKGGKIFSRSSKRGDLPRPYARQEPNREATLLNHDRDTSSAEEMFEALVRAFAPDSVLVDASQRVQHLYGNANRFLNPPQGEPIAAITKMLPADVSAELAALLHRADRNRHPVRGEGRHRFFLDGEARLVQLSVFPFHSQGRVEFFVCFTPAPPELVEPAQAGPESAGLEPHERARRLEQQLIATREHLQTVIEEHETANEELQALNEELQSSNEELQSTNEELETTNEELQSANEELTTLNEEVNVKTVELLTLNQRLNAIQNAIFYPLLMVDPGLRLSDYNPAARYVLRVGEADRGQPLRSIALGLDVGPVLDLLEGCLADGRDAKIQFRASERDFEARVQVFRGVKDQVDGAVVSFVENTQLVQALEESREAQERFLAIFENTPAIVSMKNAVGAYVLVNRRFGDVLGLLPEQVLGKTDEELFGPEVGGALRERDFEVLRVRAPIRVEETIPMGGQRRIWLSSKFPLLDDRRSAHSICSVSLDITERHEREAQLELFRRVISASNAGLAIFMKADGEYRSTLVSREMVDRLRLPSAVMTPGVPLASFLDQALAELPTVSVPAIRRGIESQPIASFTLQVEDRDGAGSWIELKAAQIALGPNDASYLILVTYDATERMQAQRIIHDQQDELARFTKLATVGELAAGISHEINTPLNVITTKTDLLRRLAEKERLEAERVRQAAGEIDQMVQNISSVITGLRAMAGKEEDPKGQHDLVGLIREAARVAAFRVQRAGAEIRLDLPEQPVMVQCQPVQIMQICINLLNNAADAVSHLKERWIRIAIDRFEGRVVVRFVDSGRGIDPSLAEKIMTPFFTTKRDQQGTGLGLSISRKIAKHHGGDLRLIPGGRNTTFELELPDAPGGAMSESEQVA